MSEGQKILSVSDKLLVLADFLHFLEEVKGVRFADSFTHYDLITEYLGVDQAKLRKELDEAENN